MAADMFVDVFVVSQFKLLQVGDAAVNEFIDVLLCFVVGLRQFQRLYESLTESS
jgi:hypothetical protein